MKIRILHTEASCGWGGQELRILDESAGLRARGHQVEIAAPAGAPIAAAAEQRQIPVHKIPVDRRNLAALRALARVITSFRPDVIVTHSSTDSWLATIVTRFQRRRPPIVRTRHLGLKVGGGIANRWLYAWVPAYVVTTGLATRKMLIDTLGIDAKKILSIPTGTDTHRFQPGDGAAARRRHGFAANVPVVGIVATLRSGKGHRFLLTALTDPGLATVRLAVVGDGPQEQTLRALAAQLNITDRVVFTGRQDDVASWLHVFDVFVLPSVSDEGVPQALSQAMACALPVISTPVGAVPELVRDGETGLFVRPGDAEGLAAAIARLLADRALAARLGAAARRHIQAGFTQVQMLDAMEHVLQQAVAGNR